MSREADNPHYVRRVVLPSGKTIEVVYFDEIPAFPAVGDSGYTESGEDLHVIRMPEHYGALSPMLHVVPLQLLAYHTACARGTDVDKPRNLAKSVTVE